MLGRYPTDQIAVAVVAALFAATGTALGLLWVYASSNHRLVEAELSSIFIRNMTIRLFVPPIVFLLSVPFSFISPLHTVLMWPVLVLPMNFIAGRRVKSR